VIKHACSVTSFWYKQWLAQGPSLGVRIFSPHDYYCTQLGDLGFPCFLFVLAPHALLLVFFVNRVRPFSFPGDIYYPNVHLGHPASFDSSVSCTTQYTVISSAASKAKVATAASKKAMDNQYLNIVNKAWRQFYSTCLWFFWCLGAICIVNPVYNSWQV